MFKLDFYNASLRKYVVLFGSLFNDIIIDHTNGTTADYESFKVPLAYGPREKFLARLEGDPNLDRGYSVSLPRMGFEITRITYDPNRKLATTGSYVGSAPAGNKNVFSKAYNPVAYDIQFRLSVMVKQAEDATRIVEQILPFFAPDFTLTVKLLDALPDYKLDIPVVLNDVSIDDTYDGSFKERRALIWNLDFTLKGYLFGPVSKSRVIKVSTVNMSANALLTPHLSKTKTSPGQLANGYLTSNSSLTVSYDNIDGTTEFGYVIIQTEYPNA
jgi:hypothetical protein